LIQRGLSQSTTREEPQSFVCRSRQVKLETFTFLVRLIRFAAAFALVLHVEHEVFGPLCWSLHTWLASSFEMSLD
jgi:hypothetical protein